VNCIEVRNGNYMERYLRGNLGEEESQRFEEHYFACEECYQSLRDLAAVQEELRDPKWSVPEPQPRTLWTGGWIWVGAAALVVFGMGLILRLQGPEQAIPSNQVLEELAAVEVPPYSPRAVRGPKGKDTQGFEESMHFYLEGDYVAAAEGLQAVVSSTPQDVAAWFYLGICQLLSDHPLLAIESLTQTIELGESRYFASAQFYRAKAYLASGEIAAARTDLEDVVRRDGPKRDEAQVILDKL